MLLIWKCIPRVLFVFYSNIKLETVLLGKAELLQEYINDIYVIQISTLIGNSRTYEIWIFPSTYWRCLKTELKCMHHNGDTTILDIGKFISTLWTTWEGLTTCIGWEPARGVTQTAKFMGPHVGPMNLAISESMGDDALYILKVFTRLVVLASVAAILCILCGYMIHLSVDSFY